MELQTVLGLKNAIKIADKFDLVISDIDHPWYKNEEILDKGEAIEVFLGNEYIVFNFLKKLKVKCILASGFPKEYFQNKFTQIGVNERVIYLRNPLMTTEWHREIKNFMKK